MAIMCRDHRGFVEATVACSKLGASAAATEHRLRRPQIADVMRRENPAGLVYDADFANLVRDGGEGRKRFVGWSEPGARRDPLLEDLIAKGSSAELDPAAQSRGRVVILTSGTTGTPKGAARKQPDSLEPAAALFSKIPLQGARDDADRRADVPLVGLRALHARPAAVLDARAAPTLRSRGRRAGDRRHRATALAVVPVMLHGSSSWRPRRSPSTTPRAASDCRQRLGTARRARSA